jgi:Na+/H+ antiporter NhaD/arsenite permease-like protein
MFVYAFIAVLFVLGYLAIALEKPLKVNKAASALILGTLLWIVWFLASGHNAQGAANALPQLFETLGSTAEILFFLMGAMAIVGVVDANNGFAVISSRIRTKNFSALIWILALITFFLSAVLDNLTTTIVMLTLAHKLVKGGRERLYLAGVIVIAANAGGAWSPIGDVTTTMLWIGGQVSAGGIVRALFVPALVSLLLPLTLLSVRLKHAEVSGSVQDEIDQDGIPNWQQNLFFFVGIGGLVLVPVLKTITHVPPYIAMFFVLGILWVIVEVVGSKYENRPDRLDFPHLLTRVDLASVLFFAGILFAVGVLEHTGQLHALAHMLETQIGDLRLIVLAIGVASSIIDNVPLVAATMGMYPLSAYPMDHLIWEFIAFCAGTGGSMLVIGSAAGVAAMGIDKKLGFGWYLTHITPLAFLGYGAGAGTYLLMHALK